ncbi:MAG: stage 0 sporulation family protein [Acidobacteriota bacterium]
MSTTLGLRFRENGQIYYFDALSYEVRVGEYVLVKTDQGTAMARVASVLDAPPSDMQASEIKPILRLASNEDMIQHDENRELARDAIRHCRRCISDRNLDMKLVDVEILLDRSKMVFYFTAPGRIDFRELVKDLVKAYRTRIELRQIGVRHETQMLGAIGNCGQMCCCARFIRKFQPVTIKMAKEQNLFLNPAKISGMCGRLLCCLAYEQNAYEEFQRRCPKIGKKYQTSQGPVKILRSNLFTETLSIYTESGEEKEITLDEWRAIAGETWTPYITPQQAPQQRPPQQQQRPAPQQKAPAPAQAAPGADAPVQAASQPPQGLLTKMPAEPTDGDDGEIVAEGQPEAAAQARPKRKRKRKPKSRRPEGAPTTTPDSGE